MSHNSTPTVNKGGRPPGPDTPASIMARELRETVKTARNIREMVETQASAIQKALEGGDLTIAARLEIMRNLAEIMGILTKNVETLGKYSLGPANRRPHANDDDGPAELSSTIKGLLKSNG